MEKLANIEKTNITLHPLLLKIRNDPHLQKLENRGFQSGDAKQKNPDISIEDYNEILFKQFADYLKAYDTKTAMSMMKTLADLRNVAGLMFLRINDSKTFEER